MSDTQEQIDSLKAAIAELGKHIVELNAMLQQALTPAQRRAIEASIAGLEAQKSELQDELNDLQAAATEVPPVQE
jgi:chromosome segregation ATPase